MIVMENHGAAEALEGSFTAALAAGSGEALDYHAVAHPSVPNYLALESGSTWDVSDDSFHALPPADLGHELTAEGISWRAYMEGLGPAGCLASPPPYDPGHNPFAFFGEGCGPRVVGIDQLAPDLRRPDLPALVWIGPDTCHDQHSCPVATGDEWLRQAVGEIRGSPAWRPGAVILITWDEDGGSSGNNVLALVVAYGGTHRVSRRPYDHYSFLATAESLLGAGRLGESRFAAPMTDLLPARS